MRDADGQQEKAERAEEDGSMGARRARENMGRLRRVEGTDKERAPGRRALAYALCGRMSRMRTWGSERRMGRSAGERAGKASGDMEDDVGGTEILGGAETATAGCVGWLG